MTKEDKELLLKDLCARLPYGVKCNVPFNQNVKRLIGIECDDVDGNLLLFDRDGENLPCECYLSEVKPYLRPMESMTEDEITEIYEYAKPYIIEAIGHDAESDNPDRKVEIKNEFLSDAVIIDELIKRHLDYRGLIPMGLALPAEEGMYNYTKVDEKKLRENIAKKLVDALIYDNDYVNRWTPFDESKHYGGWIEKIAEKVSLPLANQKYFTDEAIDTFAVGDFSEKEDMIKEHPELRELDKVLDEYYDYLCETFSINN